jgi:hypothetical protein
MTELRNVRILSEDETVSLAELLNGQVDSLENPNKATFHGRGLGNNYQGYLGENVLVRGYLMNGNFQRSFIMRLFRVGTSGPEWEWEFVSSASRG